MAVEGCEKLVDIVVEGAVFASIAGGVDARSATEGVDLSFTDDASVAARKEIPLAFEAGERFNLKITTPEDLILAEALCSCNP